MTTAFIVATTLLVLALVAALMDVRMVRAQRDEACAKLKLNEAWVHGNLQLIRFEFATVSVEAVRIAEALDKAFLQHRAIDIVSLKNEVHREQLRHDASILREASQLIRSADETTKTLLRLAAVMKGGRG